MMQAIRTMVSTVVVLALAGCASSRVYFEEPVGSKLILDAKGAKSYTLPAAIDLPQTDNPAELELNVGGQPVRMSLSDGTKLKGYLYVYKLNMDQVEKLAEVSFRLTDEQVSKLKNGEAILVFGYSARNRPVYKMNLGLDR